MKQLLTFLFAVAWMACSFSLFAATQAINLRMKSGEVITCTINRHPQITYGSNQVRLTSETLDVEYPVSEVDRLYFTGSSDLQSVTADRGEMKNAEGRLSFSGYAPGSLVRVVTASGQLLVAEKTDEQGSLSIDLSAYPQGIYLINANGTTYKIVKK